MLMNSPLEEASQNANHKQHRTKANDVPEYGAKLHLYDEDEPFADCNTDE
ncbi:hypothetical protein [Pseudomonas phage vB_Pae_CF177c]|nr:hypothetical protein [Pseudomonas phage vB_Pae_CF177c]QBI80699.1 hypothetical protein [Pseudomonas phage vB_Pae_CF213a]